MSQAATPSSHSSAHTVEIRSLHGTIDKQVSDATRRNASLAHAISADNKVGRFNEPTNVHIACGFECEVVAHAIANFHASDKINVASGEINGSYHFERIKHRDLQAREREYAIFQRADRTVCFDLHASRGLQQKFVAAARRQNASAHIVTILTISWRVQDA